MTGSRKTKCPKPCHCRPSSSSVQLPGRRGDGVSLPLTIWPKSSFAEDLGLDLKLFQVCRSGRDAPERDQPTCASLGGAASMVAAAGRRLRHSKRFSLMRWRCSGAVQAIVLERNCTDGAASFDLMGHASTSGRSCIELSFQANRVAARSRVRVAPRAMREAPRRVVRRPPQYPPLRQEAASEVKPR